MVNIKRANMTPSEKAELENALAAEQRNAANIDYIAMMCDVDIPTEEEGIADESEI